MKTNFKNSCCFLQLTTNLTVHIITSLLNIVLQVSLVFKLSYLNWILYYKTTILVELDFGQVWLNGFYCNNFQLLQSVKLKRLLYALTNSECVFTPALPLAHVLAQLDAWDHSESRPCRNVRQTQHLPEQPRCLAEPSIESSHGQLFVTHCVRMTESVTNV